MRFIAATSRNLEDLMAKKLFREDLYYRLSVFPISLPDLSRRKDDIILLAQHFLEKTSLKYGKNITRFSSPAISMLQSYDWPGNVRELENCIERAVLTAKDDCIRGYNLPPAVQGGDIAESPYETEEAPEATMADKVAAYERKLLEEALSKHGGNQSAAGRELGISPRMMCYKMKKAGIVQ